MSRKMNLGLITSRHLSNSFSVNDSNHVYILLEFIVVKNSYKNNEVNAHVKLYKLEPKQFRVYLSMRACACVYVRRYIHSASVPV